MSADWISRAKCSQYSVGNFIGGRLFGQLANQWLDKVSPRDGSLLYRISDQANDAATEAVGAAKRAYEDGRWSRLPIPQRKAVLHRLAALVERNREELALLECVDVGKPIDDTLSFDIPSAAGLIKFSAEAMDKLHGRVYCADHSSLSYELIGSLGVVAGIVGWNFPLVLAAGKIAPALAAGNSIVLKPSELTALSTLRLAQLAIEAGVPADVFNVVVGARSVGETLAAHPAVDLVTFTGSSKVGKDILIASGQSNLKRVILECGGKSPNIVFEDGPSLGAVADAVLHRAFWNQGQVCTASSRLLVQRNIKDELVALIRKKVAELAVGDPLVEGTKLGAVVSRAQQSKIKDYIRLGKQEGARIVYEGQNGAPHADGFYMAPVIFDEVPATSRIAQEEIFGPVLSVMSFRDENEAIQLANGTVYGLSAILWTKDLGRAHRLTQEIRAGWTVVNAVDKPRGGPGVGVMSVGGMKESGLGLEGGLDGILEYSRRTSVQFFV